MSSSEQNNVLEQPAASFCQWIQVEYRVCDQCACPDSPSTRLRLCGGCRTTQYCSSECQKRHWPSHKRFCQHTAAQIEQASSNSIADGIEDTDLVKTLRKFCAVHTTLLGWAGFHALRLKESAANMRQNLLLLDLSYDHQKQRHRRLSLISASVVPRTYISDSLLNADIERRDERSVKSGGMGAMVIVLKCGSTSEVMTFEINIPEDVAWGPDALWREVLTRYIEGGQDVFDTFLEKSTKKSARRLNIEARPLLHSKFLL